MEDESEKNNFFRELSMSEEDVGEMIYNIVRNRMVLDAVKVLEAVGYVVIPPHDRERFGWLNRKI
jgi:hypothetical protein